MLAAVYTIIITGGPYTVTFDANGGEGTVPEPITQESVGAAIEIPYNSSGGFSDSEGNTYTYDELTKAGFLFAGWNTRADGNGTHYEPGSSYTPTADITLYAQWVAEDEAFDYMLSTLEKGTPSTTTLNNLGLTVEQYNAIAAGSAGWTENESLNASVLTVVWPTGQTEAFLETLKTLIETQLSTTLEEANGENKPDYQKVYIGEYASAYMVGIAFTTADVKQDRGPTIPKGFLYVQFAPKSYM